MSMTIQQAIENRERFLKYLEGYAAETNPESVEAVRLSLEALREKAEREDPKPLTLEKLLAVNEEPVWIWFVDAPGRWVLRAANSWIDTCCPERMTMFNMKWYKHSAYGADWLAYRHKPKEVA